MTFESLAKKAVCLLSGGLDSTTVLYFAVNQGFDIHALSLYYGQLHHKEVECARRIATALGLRHDVIRIELPWKGSALLDAGIPLPVGRTEREMAQGIPSTYVPARNTLFLSYAASLAETVGAEKIFIGANALDYSGYPDCRPDYMEIFNELLKKGTKAGAEGKAIRVEAPLIAMNKKEIVLLGSRLSVPFHKTWSCYQGGEAPCGECDSCRLRAKGFREAQIKDPLLEHALSRHE